MDVLSSALALALAAAASAAPANENSTTTEATEVKESKNGWITVIAGLFGVIGLIFIFIFARSRCCGAIPKPRPLSEVESEKRKSELRLRSTPSTPSGASIYTTGDHKMSPGAVSQDSLASSDAHLVELRIQKARNPGPASPPPSYTSEVDVDPGGPRATAGPSSPPPSYDAS